MTPSVTSSCAQARGEDRSRSDQEGAALPRVRHRSGALARHVAVAQLGGAAADVVVWTGDPLEPLSQPTAVFVGGVEQPLTSRATELRDRYMPGERARPVAYPR